MGLKIKVCGLNNEKNALEVLKQIEPDYIGNILHSKSKRLIKAPFSTSFYQCLKKTKIVGVFVNENIEKVLKKVELYRLNAVQLHGKESPAYCREVKSKLNSNIEVWKAIGITNDVDILKLERYIPFIDSFLFDTPLTEKSVITVGGGTGKRWNWELLENYNYNTPYILSGGISNDDIEAMLMLSKQQKMLSMIDVNSRYEISPGIKNMNDLKLLKGNLT